MPSMRVLALVLVFAVSALAQAVRVRLVDKDGHPLQNKPVYAQFSPPAKASMVMPRLRSQTDANGEAEFTVPQPTPEHLWVSVGLDFPPGFCDACTFVLDTASVLQKGVVRYVPRSKAPVAGMKAQPGVIMVHARPMTLTEKILWKVFKGEL